ncbi:MAG: ATP-binding protein [Staphylococcus sp.]|nr:ATP-binding protein [Staphylococcus sp.]
MRLLILIFTALIPLAFSGREIPLKHLDTVNRLSNNKINVLHSDSDGFLWIGTSAGLYRYDGYTYKNYAPADTSMLDTFEYYIEEIQEDADGHLWIYSGQKYSIYDPVTDRITSDIKPFLEKSGIGFIPSHITIDERKGMWLHSPANGLFYLEPGTAKPQPISHKAFLNCEITDISSTPYGTVTIDNKGTMRILAPATREVTRTDSLITKEMNGRHFVFLLKYDRDGLCWVFNNEQLWVYDIAHTKWLNDLLPPDRGSAPVKILTQDHSGTLWIGRDHCGLEQVVKKDGRFSFVNIANSSEPDMINTVTALYEDNGGTLWIGTYKKGLYCYNPSVRKFALRNFPDVNCILPSSADKGEVWLGTDGDGLLRWRPETDAVSTVIGPSAKIGAITSLLETPDGSLYVGSYTSGLKRLRNGNIEILLTGTDLDKQYTWALSQGKNGTLWVGTLGGGLFHLNPADMSARQYTTANSGLSADYIIKFASGENGQTYIATSHGVSILNTSDGTFTSIPGLENTSINDIILDSRGLLWIASTHGLKLYDPKRSHLVSLNLASANPHPNLILGLKEDRNGKIWVAEGGKLIAVEVQFDDKTGKLAYTMHRYDGDDGLQNSDFNQRSFALLPNGEMLVGGLYGINSFIPDNIVYNRSLPRVMFSDIYIGSQKVRIGEKIDGHIVLKSSPNRGSTLELWPGQTSFTVTFGTDNHILPEKTTYQYKLEGFDKDWTTTEPGVNRAYYANLPAGSYRLLVKARNNDGYESSSAAELKIKIHPTFWLTTWAKIIYTILLILLIYAVYRLIRRRERHRFNEKRREDAILKQEEVNQLKFKFYTNVSHELRTPLTLIVSPLESMIKETSDPAQLRRLTLMRNNALRLLTLVNQLLDFRKNEVTGLSLHLAEGELVDFVRNVCHSFANLSEKKNIKLNFTSSTTELYVMFDEDKLYKAIINLLGNAFKFTPEGGEVTVALSASATNVTIDVTDTGIGISDSDKTHIFERFYQTSNTPTDSTMTGNGIGLSMASEYIQLHNGTITVEDNPGGGTKFSITLPLIKSSGSRTQSPAVAETVHLPGSDNPISLSGLTDNEIDIKEGSPAGTGSDKPTVLVVDDSRDMIEFLRDGLSHDFHVITANDGEAALKLLASIRPAIILTDLMMPGIDGAELCRRLKADPAHSSTPVIILTAKHDMSTRVESLTLGADDYVTKPFNVELLIIKMKKLISLSRKTGRSLIDPEPDDIKITPLDEKMVEKAVKYVVSNIKRPDLSVEELSSHLGMSRVHLYKKLKATTGKTPVEFIRLIRLKRGAQMLRESQLNVSEIAFQLGYNNPKYFSKYFKEEFGVLPSVYQDKEGKETNCPV